MKMVRIHAASDAQDLSIWKILGAIAVLAPKFPREREVPHGFATVGR